ncbi:hypothetical protein CWO90_41260 [Bradyrhizobium sp. Leo121]|nr:hypothetical protein CWO90_41260 [Bradyrhizobium sp. Leo121]
MLQSSRKHRFHPRRAWITNAGKFNSRSARRSTGTGWLEDDPESGNRFSEKVMLKQGDEIMIRFRPIGS